MMKYQYKKGNQTGILLIFVIVFTWICIVFNFKHLICNTHVKDEKITNSSRLTTKKLSKSNDFRDKAIYWRKKAGEMYCKNSNDAVGPTGGWCLVPGGQTWNYGVPSALHHVEADEGIGRGILKYLNKVEKRITLLDIGAGVGQYGGWLKANNANIEWYGFDGAENVESFTNGMVKWLDVTDPSFDTINFTADWVMCLEVGEHIAPEFTDILIQLLHKHNVHGILLSWAIPGQGGHSHINEKPNDDIINRFLSIGYVQDPFALSFQSDVRSNAKYFWFRNTFMVFSRMP